MKNSYISSFEKEKIYRFSWKFFVILLFLIVSSVMCLEVINRTLYIPKTNEYKRIKKFEETRADVEVVFLGDSHVKRAINQKELSLKAVNLGFGGANYIELFYFFDNYFNDGMN
jgi:hypothetical protein